MPPFAEGLSLQNERTSTIDDTWKPVWGTHAVIRNHANELTVTLEEKNAPSRTLEFIVRVYDEGVGFRYSIPAQAGMGKFKLASERSEFHFPPEQSVWAADYGSFRSRQETEFIRTKISEINPGTIIGCPLLVQLDDVWILREMIVTRESKSFSVWIG